MIVQAIGRQIDEHRVRQLDEFESAFRYPLGPAAWFRISHAPDYSRFYESIGATMDVAAGRSECFVAEESQSARGTISVAIKQVVDPESQVFDAAYFGDLKVLPGVGRGLVAVRLVQAASRWALERVSVGLAVVMEGTTVLPNAYTGRLGIPEFAVLSHIAILRIPAAANCADAWLERTSRDSVDESFRDLTRGGFATRLGACQLRSQIDTIPMRLDGGQACGILEDTRRAKRLWIEGGDELVSAHLSCFAFRTPRDGATLLSHARHVCATLGLPAFFTAVDRRWADDLLRDLVAATDCSLENITRAGAIVFGHGLPSGTPWHLHTAEI